ncbi:hypothetical protein TNCV_1889331 [Trichonephila clavipes]|nr:hypothetical protein TNCV_1889331 [Trichonephila clavipes]
MTFKNFWILQKLTNYELLEMHEQDEELESQDPVQSGDRMTEIILRLTRLSLSPTYGISSRYYSSCTISSGAFRFLETLALYAKIGLTSDRFRKSV